MRLRPILALLLGTALLVPAAARLVASRPDPPLCQVQARSAPDNVPGFFIVRVELRPICPAHAVADVRLESYVGATYPRRGFERITASTPLIRRGIPYWWRAAWRSKAGTVFPLIIPGMTPPYPGEP